MYVLRASLTVLFAAVLGFAQQTAPVAPQTPRQALIEMIAGGEKGVTKHLTIEVQQAFKKAGRSGLGVPLGSPDGLQTFESGTVLLSYHELAQNNKKTEVHVDNDDLNGEEDNLDLSIHSFTDGQEQPEVWQSFLSHFTVSMRRQEGIWRLDKIAIGAEFPVGDAAFMEKMFGRSGATGASVGLYGPVAETHVAVGATSQAAPGMSPEQVVTMLGFAESAYARSHPDSGFTCSLSELAATSRMMGVDQQVSSGAYNGYRFVLAGCEGKPAGSFQITAEPILMKPDAKAFCTDATQNVRVSDDGRGATCLASGKPRQFGGSALRLNENGAAETGLDAQVVISPKN